MNLFVTLYAVNFIRTLLIIGIIYIAIRFISRYVFPFLFEKGMKNMQHKMQDQFREQQRANRREGDVTIEKNRRNSSTKDNEGEYVDFEEVE